MQEDAPFAVALGSAVQITVVPGLVTTTTQILVTSAKVFALFSCCLELCLREDSLFFTLFPFLLFSFSCTFLFKAPQAFFKIFKSNRFSFLNDLPVIQKTYDLVRWYIPILNRLPKSHKFGLGERMVEILYDLLENLIIARYAKSKVPILESLNAKIDILTHQTRLLLDFNLMETDRYEYVIKLIHEIGKEVGGWLKHQKNKPFVNS